ncbi:hypothetical protein [Methylobacterium sp. Leaf113]|uniref:hypothetical protein n=1 Tax=Methylobacterium sp. Leaf113 TaxID=1736259 RepID=UPI0012E945DC|nr:hypothetical protein [Methylobacterium sp. Leaf113]
MSASCNTFDNRRGLKPIIDANSVQVASANTNLVVAALSRDAGSLPGEPIDYYLVALAGFNYVDDQCRQYFDELFFINRGREQAKSGLAAAAQTTAAVLGVTGASATSLAVVAQAFGFSISATDVIAGTYLYSLPPATTQGFVQKLQSAFRDGAAQRRAAINSAPAAYYVIQRYLELCLPPRIEAEITKQISAAGAVDVRRGNGALFSLETVSVPSRYSYPDGPLGAASRSSYRYQDPPTGPSLERGRGPTFDDRQRGDSDTRPKTSSSRLARRTERPGSSDGPASSGLAALYAGDPFDRTKQLNMQKALVSLCLTPNQMKDPGPEVRDRIDVYQEYTVSGDSTGKLDDAAIRYLLGKRPCEAPHKNFYEKSLFPNGMITGQTIKFLEKVLPGNRLEGPPNLAAIRSQISSVRAVPAVSVRLKSRLSGMSDQITPDLIAVLDSL